MAMSFCSNWGTLQHLNPEMISFQQREAELARELLGLHNNITPQNNFIDPFLEPDELFSENYTHLLPYFPSPDDPLVSLSPEIFPPVDDFECYQYPKRQKSYEDLYYSDFVPSCFEWRRRKITEKTQELGKLIPGGNKMNTAEMFQAAFKYVKYLQAQVGLLELMGKARKHSM
ncbi:hypothetical protein HHK36_000736 [Tetracentron sinense]|uniref:BHLH domain-containing protein n=1 Tax=Tetracentron sinense TaxID=13715 RepID=A0A834ZSQ2_TETSI|nr:hypothetical protein HHK36_000736 [Tetracentron sinense]